MMLLLIKRAKETFSQHLPTQAAVVGQRDHRTGSRLQPPPHSRYPCYSSSNRRLTLKVDTNTHLKSVYLPKTHHSYSNKSEFMYEIQGITFFFFLMLRANVSRTQPRSDWCILLQFTTYVIRGWKRHKIPCKEHSVIQYSYSINIL